VRDYDEETGSLRKAPATAAMQGTGQHSHYKHPARSSAVPLPKVLVSTSYCSNQGQSRLVQSNSSVVVRLPPVEGGGEPEDMKAWQEVCMQATFVQ
jgi:hypothetical protein